MLLLHKFLTDVNCVNLFCYWVIFFQLLLQLLHILVTVTINIVISRCDAGYEIYAITTRTRYTAINIFDTKKLSISCWLDASRHCATLCSIDRRCRYFCWTLISCCALTFKSFDLYLTNVQRQARYTPCLKNVSHLACYNFDTRERILTFLKQKCYR